jgi:DNA repair photolyase
MKYENKFNKAKSEYGVGEWADWSYNIGIGCKNNCLYCYAKADAVKYNNIANRECWVNEKVNPYKVDIQVKADGRVMFPSTHDITPYYLPSYIKTLENILKAGNDVLIVSKPHLECVQELCRSFTDYKDKIEFRFTIGTLEDKVSKFWEPGAPLPLERLKALKHAYDAGFNTSVSMEPMLEGYIEAVCVYKTVAQFVNGTIWIGMMNQLNKRVDISIEVNKVAVERIGILQSDANIMKLYRELKNESTVRWKDSIKDVVKRRVV